MTLPISGSQLPPSFPEAIKKVHDRCEFLYSRIEQSAKEFQKINPNSEKKWSKRLLRLKSLENSVFSIIKDRKNLKMLEQKCKQFESALKRLADAFPDSMRPKLDSKNERTLSKLVSEAMEAGRYLSRIQRKNDYLSEAETGPYPLLTEAPELIAEVLSKNVSLRDLVSLSEATKRMHPEVKKEIRNRKVLAEKFGENGPPLREVIGSKKDKDILSYFQGLTDGEREDIHTLNFDELALKERTILQLLNLCPNVKEVVFHHNPPRINKELLKVLSDQPKIEKIDIKYVSLSQLPHDFARNKLTGIKLRPNNEAVLQLQLKMLADQGAVLKHLAVLSPSLTKIPQLPDQLISLDLSECIRVTEIQNFPSDLKHFAAVDADLQDLPPLSEGIETLILSGNVNLNIPDLPSSVKSLALSHIDAIEEINALPEYLEHLECGGLPNLRRLPETLPKSLKTLVVVECPLLERLPPLPPNCKLIQDD